VDDGSAAVRWRKSVEVAALCMGGGRWLGELVCAACISDEELIDGARRWISWGIFYRSV
jgi:hypothetical protein